MINVGMNEMGRMHFRIKRHKREVFTDPTRQERYSLREGLDLVVSSGVTSIIYNEYTFKKVRGNNRSKSNVQNDTHWIQQIRNRSNAGNYT